MVWGAKSVIPDSPYFDVAESQIATFFQPNSEQSNLCFFFLGQPHSPSLLLDSSGEQKLASSQKSPRKQVETVFASKLSAHRFPSDLQLPAVIKGRPTKSQKPIVRYLPNSMIFMVE
ncbi:MAG: hypothetical protein NXI22_11975 [bacterium]|nr:hypothetical protein [bacterium]